LFLQINQNSNLVFFKEFKYKNKNGFLREVVNKLYYPAAVFVGFLAVGYEDVVFVTGDEDQNKVVLNETMV
jgi:hypothetical protein